MKAVLLSLVTTAALLVSTSVADAQPRQSNFTSSIILSPGINSSPYASGYVYPPGTFSMGIGNIYTTPYASGYGYTYPAWNSGWYSYSQPYYGGFSTGYYGGYSSGYNGGYYGVRRHYWNR